MTECHKCPHNGKRSNACLRCAPDAPDGNGTPHGGAHLVSIDEVDGFERPKPMQRMKRDPRLMLAKAFEAWMMLPAKLQVVVRLRYLDQCGFEKWTYAEIAKRCRITIQAAEKRHKTAMRRWPALRTLFFEKAAKQSRRKQTPCS